MFNASLSFVGKIGITLRKAVGQISTLQQMSLINNPLQKWLTIRQTSKSEMMWEVWSNEDPENQLRTSEHSELSLFQRSSMSTPSEDVASRDFQPILDHEVHSFCTARLKASRSSRDKLRIDTSTRRFSGLRRSRS